MARKSSPKKLAYMKTYAGKNKARRKSYMADYSAKNAAAIARSMRSLRLWKVHRLKQSDYDAMLARQGGHCALCHRRPEEEHFGVLHIDHDHLLEPGSPGYFRGLLCFFHNAGLQRFGDNEAGLLRALEYVSKKRWLPWQG